MLCYKLSTFCALIFLSYHNANGDMYPISVENFSKRLDEYIFNFSNATNLIWSPVSVYSSLLPFLAGASGQTLSELKSVLYLENETEFNHEWLNFNQPNLTLCTGLFVEKQLKLKENFTKEFDSVQTFDNSTSSTNLTEMINNWVRDATHNLIPKMLDSVDENAEMIIANAVVFNGIWKLKFQKGKTSNKIFNGLTKLTHVEMMYQSSVQNYGIFNTSNEEEFTVMKMGYRDSDMQIIFVLPANPQGLANVFNYVTENMRQVLELLEPTELEIEIPKMKVESQVGVKDALEKAGLKSLFSSETSNLSKMFDGNTTISRRVDEFIHKTVFELDEDGTKAAASTVSMILPLTGLSSINFSIDRPFIVFLRWQGKFTFFEGVVTDLQDAVNNEIQLDNAVVSNSSQANKVSTRGDSDWWVQTGPPEYAQDDDESSNNISTPNTPNSISSINRVSKTTSDILEKDRFQQPEPKDPHGIRFPNPALNYSLLQMKFIGTLHEKKIQDVPFVSNE